VCISERFSDGEPLLEVKDVMTVLSEPVDGPRGLNDI